MEIGEDREGILIETTASVARSASESASEFIGAAERTSGAGGGGQSVGGIGEGTDAVEPRDPREPTQTQVHEKKEKAKHSRVLVGDGFGVFEEEEGSGGDEDEGEDAGGAE